MTRVFALLLSLILPVSVHAQVADKKDGDTQIPQTVDHRVLSAAQIEQYRKKKSYRPVLRDEFLLLLQQQEKNTQENHSIIQRAEYSATLSGSSLLDGQISFHLKDDLKPDQVRRQLSLGVTNMQKVRLFSGNEKLNLATDSTGNLICLGDLQSPVITGTWILQGTPVAQATVFQVNFPAASLCKLNLETDSDIEVTSPNALLRHRYGVTGNSQWTLFPGKSTTVTISCARRTEYLRAETVGLTVVADCKIQRYGSLMSWNVGVPHSLTDAILLFNFSQDCEVESVSLGNGSPPRWDIVTTGEQKKLRVWVPSSQTGMSFDIRTAIAISDGSIEVPFLVPDSWHPALSELGGALLLRSSTIRVTMPPDFVVTDVATGGVFEQQVQFLADDSQLLILKQFAQTAHARFSTVIAKPLIEDSIVVSPSAQPGVTDAYVSAVAMSGSTGTLQYDVPNSWRVTEVSELATGIPILFRLSDSISSDHHSALQITLRSPLMAGRVQAVQQFRIQLQSTAGQLQREIPTLDNSSYQRRNDYVVLTENNMAARRLPGVTGKSLSELRTQLPWLPTFPVKQAEAQIAFARSELQLTSDSVSASEDLVATLDYSVSADAGVVNESVILSLQSPSELPSEILLRVTPGVELNITTDLNSSANVALRRINVGRKFDDWQLRVSRKGNRLREFQAELSTSRPLVGSMTALVVEIPRSVSKGGTVRPPIAPTVGLVDAGGGPVRSTQQYPSRPFAAPFRLQPPTAQSTPLIVSGNAFLMAGVAAEGLQVETRYRLNVRSGQTSAKLEMQCSGAESVRVFVDGKPVYPDTIKDHYQVPLGTGRQSMEIDVLVVMSVERQLDSVFDIPIMTLRNAGTPRLNYFMLSPQDQMPACEGAVVETQAEALASVTGILTDSNQKVFSDQTRPLQQFESRWQFHAARPQVACLIATQPTGSVLQVRLYDKRFDALKTLLTALVFLLLLFPLRSFMIGWWTIGCVLLFLVVSDPHSSMAWRPFVHGGLSGAVVAGLLFILGKLKFSRLFLRSRTVKVGLQSATAIGVMTMASAYGFDEESLPQVLVPDSALPMIYIEDDWLSQLRENAKPSGIDALVVATDLKLELLSPAAAAVEIVCDVATRPDQTSELLLPLDGLTLVTCVLDGQPVFPTRNAAGQTAIVIPPRSLLPSTQLTEDQKKIGSVGPETIGNFVRRSVRYTVRLVPEVAGDTLKFLIPHPASPGARLVVADPANIAATANRIGAKSIVADFRNQQVDFPPVFNSRLFDVAVRLKKTDGDVASAVSSCEIVCRAEVAPAEVRLTCEYRDLPVDERSQTVRIGGHRNFRVTAVESLTGQRLQWSIDQEELVVQVDAALSQSRALVVQRVTETAMSLRHSIPLREITTVNEVRAEIVTLSASTSGLFFVDAIMVGDVPLTDMPASTMPKLPDGLRATDRVIPISPQTAVVEVQLAAQQTTREARLIQNVLVTEQEIQWSCRCEIEIAGQPAFRQTLRLSPNVQIQSVTASNGDVSRLHSWFRNGDLITVFLREGIRGSLDLEIQGTVKRELNIDTPLPTIGRPIEILEYLLKLSASPGTDIYISDLAGNVPHSPIDIEATPIPDKPDSPMTLSVTDESKPLVIRANPERRITGQVAMVAYEVDDRVFLAQFLQLHTPDAAFNTPFESPKSAAFATSRLWLSQSGEPKTLTVATAPETIRVLPLADGGSIVGITEIVMARGIDRLVLPVPDFGSDVAITEVQAFDLRSAEADSSLPVWLQLAISQTKLAPSVLQTGRFLDSRFDAESQTIEIRMTPVQQTKELLKASGGPVFASVDHQVNMQGGELITGVSGFLVFSVQERQRIGIQMPVGTSPTAVRVDGVPLPFEIDQNELFALAADRVSFVTVDWVRSLADAIAEDVKIPFPRVNAVQTSVFASALQAGETDWQFSNSAQDPEVISNDRLRSLTTGLQMIESETLSEDDAAAVSEQNRNNGLPAGPIWQKLARESFDAAFEFAEFLEEGGKESFGEHRDYVTEPEELRLVSSRIPSAAKMSLLFFASMMFLLPLVHRGRAARRAPAEASTVVTQPRMPVESEEPTMIGVDSLK